MPYLVLLWQVSEFIYWRELYVLLFGNFYLANSTFKVRVYGSALNSSRREHSFLLWLRRTRRRTRKRLVWKSGLPCRTIFSLVIECASLLLIFVLDCDRRTFCFSVLNLDVKTRNKITKIDTLQQTFTATECKVIAATNHKRKSSDKTQQLQQK